ncbi:hypothetical protein P3X46_028673 [Hevea brasiliensis]|uniref:Cysteine-rich receptor-like protein kinase n=1 Tax=Hevea brasiliensis TaxID=3981 RepID=A0ABQ9KSV8_HEVBR|nr:cysteine-rich receptor-like protein kinase 44 [Hevea brasiliensis]KAJ9146403.1 hypothetical protein P3X46_028673 [Hevea brasiliensis]
MASLQIQMVYLLCSIFLHFIALTTSQPELLYHHCLDKLGNYTANSTYQANLRRLLNSMYTDTEIDSGFYNFSYGENNNKVYAIALCRADVRPDTCRECINNSSIAITSLCPNQKEAIVGFEKCMLRYTGMPIFGLLEVEPSSSWYNLNFVSDINGFNKSLYSLLDRQRNQAAAGDSRLKYASGKISAPDFQTIYALSQCTPDLSQSQCSYCLYNASGVIPQCCRARQGGTVVLPSCNLRYEINQFYDGPVGEFPSSQDPSKGKQSVVIIIIVSAVISVILIICISIILRRKKPREDVKSADGIIDVESLRFDLETIRLATNNFSEANEVGKGGFGAVYKGTFPNGEDIAVKRLSRDSRQGELEFMNEILLVAKLKHKNLVTLRGFCFEQGERLLVYEFLPNLSLNSLIFDPVQRLQLDWEKRYVIIKGIARGLLYLHEDSRFRLIHRDLKTSNILLDEQMNPKISDFGMARLFAADQTQDNTKRVVGTLGYMPPEYVKHGKFSIKSDVFSFGVIVLEIVSGRTRSFRNGEDFEDLLTYAWKNWNQGTALNLIDPTLSVGSRNEMIRCIHIGLLCVQENLADRPTMASVVIMLSSCSLSLPVPLKPAFFVPNIVLPEASSSLTESYCQEQSSKNDASISEMYPR